jgi:hypothetical protein
MKKRVDKNKQFLINVNITQSKLGLWQNCFTGKALKTTFVSNFNVGVADNICDVLVINKHTVDVIPEFCDRGFNSNLKDGWMNPVAMCTVNKDFIASNFPQSEGIIDDYYNLRTNYNVTIMNGNPYPLKNKECVYNKYLTVIRDENMNPLDLNNIYRFGIITISPITKPLLLSDSKMSSEDFINMLSSVETLFQTAIYYGHNILLLTPLGHTDDEVPQEDIIKIYNLCIYKYSHRFKYIIMCVPKWDGTYLFDLFNEMIIRPQEIAENYQDDNSDDDSVSNENSINEESINEESINEESINEESEEEKIKISNKKKDDKQVNNNKYKNKYKNR